MAAASAAGMSNVMQEHAVRLQRRDLFRFNRVGMLLELRRVASIYAGEPLRALCEANVRAGTFEDLPVPVLVNTVDIRTDAVRVGPTGTPPGSRRGRRVRLVRAARLLPSRPGGRPSLH